MPGFIPKQSHAGQHGVPRIQVHHRTASTNRSGLDAQNASALMPHQWVARLKKTVRMYFAGLAAKNVRISETVPSY